MCKGAVLCIKDLFGVYRSCLISTKGLFGV